MLPLQPHAAADNGVADMHDDFKARSLAVWSTGDYSPTSRQLEPASVALVETLGIGATPGMLVLDVAAGHGNCAVAAARAGASVIATDFSPQMVATGSARTEREGLPVVWQEAEAAALPFDAESFDRVTSVFGAIFAPEQEAVAAELVRVIRRGGLVGMTAWTPDGLTAQVIQAGREFSPAPPPDAPAPPNPFRWGEEAEVHGLFEPLGCEVLATRRTHTFRYSSWEQWREASEAHGLSVIARQQMSPGDYERMLQAMHRLSAEHNYGEGGAVVFDADYLEIVVRKP